VIGAFRDEWQGFRNFVSQEKLGEVKVNQCELTYIDHIEKGAGWETLADLGRVFKPLRSPLPAEFFGEPEVVNWSGTFKLPEGLGRLYIEICPAFRSRDFKTVLSLTLKTRGAPANGSPDAIFAWFDLAHQWAVKAFDEVTEPTLHALWGKQP